MLLSLCVCFILYFTCMELRLVSFLLNEYVMLDLKDYCHGESFQPRCSYDEVIEMQRAVYGRMELGRCVKLDMGYIGCNTSVLDLADDRCSGRRMCDISVPDLTFESTKPCLELKSYLRASYTCITGRSYTSMPHRYTAHLRLK